MNEQFEKIAEESFNDELEKIKSSLSSNIGMADSLINYGTGGHYGPIQHAIKAKQGEKGSAFLSTLINEIGYGTLGGVTGVAPALAGISVANKIKNKKLRTFMEIASLMSPAMFASIGTNIGYSKARKELHDKGIFNINNEE